MRALSLSSMFKFAGLAPLVARVIVGVIVAAHGLQKLFMGPEFGAQVREIGVPLPVLTGYAISTVELIGGILLIIGLFSRLAALVLTLNQTNAIIFVKIGMGVGFLSPLDTPGVGAELDLALIAGYLTIFFVGPGRYSLDHALGIARAPEDGRTSGEQVSTI